MNPFVSAIFPAIIQRPSYFRTWDHLLLKTAIVRCEQLSFVQIAWLFLTQLTHLLNLSIFIDLFHLALKQIQNLYFVRFYLKLAQFKVSLNTKSQVFFD